MRLKRSQVLKEGYFNGLRHALDIISQMINEDSYRRAGDDKNQILNTRWKIEKEDIDLIVDQLSELLPRLEYKGFDHEMHTLSTKELNLLMPAFEAVNAKAYDLLKNTKLRSQRTGETHGAEGAGEGTGWSLTIKNRKFIEDDPNFKALKNAGNAAVNSYVAFDAKYGNASDILTNYCGAFIVKVRRIADQKKEAAAKKRNAEIDGVPVEKDTFGMRVKGVHGTVSKHLRNLNNGRTGGHASNRTRFGAKNHQQVNAAKIRDPRIDNFANIDRIDSADDAIRLARGW